jgi:uncharacterized protein (DUF2236 family)
MPHSDTLGSKVPRLAYTRCMDSIIRLPRIVARSLDAAALDFLNSGSSRRFDFSRPRGEPALVSADSMSWRIFKNPVALWTGGIAAVILELAEPSIRAAIWEHSSFRNDPLGRLRRTGMAAMMTVYGPRSTAQATIAGVVRMHGKIRGENANGAAYSASDPRLLNWVQATAAFGFGEAYHRLVRPLTSDQFDQFYREGAPASVLYGAVTAAHSRADLDSIFNEMRPDLQPSDSIFQFLRIMNEAPALPHPLRGLQRLLVRAAVELVPGPIRERLGLSARFGLPAWQRRIARLTGSLADRIVLPQSPAAQACVRLGYPVTHLYDDLGEDAAQVNP